MARFGIQQAWVPHLSMQALIPMACWVSLKTIRVKCIPVTVLVEMWRNVAAAGVRGWQRVSR